MTPSMQSYARQAVVALRDRMDIDGELEALLLDWYTEVNDEGPFDHSYRELMSRSYETGRTPQQAAELVEQMFWAE